jgi:UDP-glucose 4-epimerase
LNEIDSASDPAKAFQVTTLGTLRLLKAAADRKVKRLVYFSTAHVYGSPLLGRIDEKTLPRPVHPYATTHKAAEDLVNEYHDKKLVEGIVIRLSNSFGYPYYQNINRWTLVVNDLCRQAVTAKKLVLKTSGTQKRDFITLTDVCRGVDHLLESNFPLDKNNIFNLGGNATHSIYDIARAVASSCGEILGFEPPVERPQPGPKEKIDRLDYRIDRILRTGFRLKGNMREEIDRTLIKCRDWFGGENARA